MRVQAAPRNHYSWLVDRVGCAITDRFRAIEAIDDAGEIHGMVGFDLWTANSVQMHVAIESPAVLRSLLGPGFEYPFGQCGRGVVTAVVAEGNPRSLTLVPRLGFSEVARVKDGWETGKALVLFEMRKENCKWIRRAA